MTTLRFTVTLAADMVGHWRPSPQLGWGGGPPPERSPAMHHLLTASPAPAAH